MTAAGLATRRTTSQTLRLGDALRRGSPLAQIVFAPPAFGRWIAAGATPAAYSTGLVQREEVRGLSPDEFLPEAVVGPLLEAFADLAQIGGVVTSYEQFLSLGGVESWWLVTVTRTAPQRTRSMLVATFFNLDFVRSVEVALQRSEENFRGLIESLPDAVLVVGEASRAVVYANRTAGVLLGAGVASELVARPWRDLFEKRSVPQVEASFADARARAAASRAEELTMVGPGGAELPVEVIVMPALFDGAPSDVVIARDVRERQRARAQLAVANRMIALGTLAAGVAHELNNPITYVKTNVEFVEEEIERAQRGEIEELDLPEIATALSEAVAGVAHAKRIVEELRGLSPSATTPRPVSLASVVETSVKRTRTEISARAVLEVAHEGDVEVEADAPRLVQVFVNLLVNASHAIEPGAPNRNVIAVRTRATGEHAVVEIVDSGVGIPETILGKLFDPFFTTKPSGVGTGLGLTICQKVIAELGGRIEVESTVGRGSTFRVLLPRAGMRDATVPGERPRLLLVDDDALVGRALTRLLRAEFDVVYRQSARDALGLLLSGAHFDVVLCDLVMPGMSGMDLYDEIRRRVPQMLDRIVFLSGATHVAAAREFLLGIPNEWLEKPVDEASLAAALARKVR